MLTINQVNKAISDKGVKAELVKGRGYFYFDGDDVQFAYTTSVMVYALNHLSMEQWMAELDSVVKDSKEREPV